MNLLCPPATAPGGFVQTDCSSRGAVWKERVYPRRVALAFENSGWAPSLPALMKAVVAIGVPLMSVREPGLGVWRNSLPLTVSVNPASPAVTSFGERLKMVTTLGVTSRVLARIVLPLRPVLHATTRSVVASTFCFVEVGLLVEVRLSEVSMKRQGVLNAGLFMDDCVMKVCPLSPLGPTALSL